MVSANINKKDQSSINLELFACRKYLNYLKMRVRKVNIFLDIVLKNFNSLKSISFYLQKFNNPLML